MANQTRLRSNSISGGILNNPLSNSGTTLTSNELVALPAVDATQHMVIVLDPTGAGLGPEIVYVTAHTAASSNATIVRGREGTSGVQHTSVRTWVHAPVVSDWAGDCTAATRPSGSGLPYQGQQIYETDTTRTLQYDGTGWRVLDEPWATFAPTYTNFSLGNGTVNTARIKRQGTTAHVEVKVTLGSTSAFTGNLVVILPYAAVNNSLGPAYLLDSGTANYSAVAGMAGTASVSIFHPVPGSNNGIVGTTSPMTWATSDQFGFDLAYEISAADARA